jgi:hypothetical protein
MIAMAKTLLQKFDEDFVRELRAVRRNPDAFERATQKWEDEHGFTPFESYDSFRRKKEWDRKKKK